MSFPVRFIAFGFLLAAVACAPERELIPVTCVTTTSRAVESGRDSSRQDTLRVYVALAEVPPRRTEILVRVDPLDQRGAVMFQGIPPETAAAASLALEADAVFQGCMSTGPEAFLLRARAAPAGRLWMRISSSRPVTVNAVPSERAHDPAISGSRLLTVEPGTSGRTPFTWVPAADAGQP